MSKSYRKPWGTVCHIKRSAHYDKTIAARMMRHAQNLALRVAVAHDADWDGWLIPERYECKHNNVWGWGRDGKQRPLNKWAARQYNNPFAYVCSPTYKSHEQIIERWYERMQQDDKLMAYASRK